MHSVLNIQIFNIHAYVPHHTNRKLSCCSCLSICFCQSKLVEAFSRVWSFTLLDGSMPGMCVCVCVCKGPTKDYAMNNYNLHVHIGMLSPSCT